MATGFLWHEKYMWHDTGSGAATNVEPGEHFENPDTKRRMKNLMDLSGITDQLVRLEPRLATEDELRRFHTCLLYTSPSPRDLSTSRMPSSA